jgi:hypothetical protein
MATQGHFIVSIRWANPAWYSKCSAICMLSFFLIATSCGAEERFQQFKRESAVASTLAQELPIIDATPDSLRRFMPEFPQAGGSCYLYPDYIVIAWRFPDSAGPVAIVRKRDQSNALEPPNCSPDSLPGDFIVRNEWAEYFAGMWRDLLFIDSGTSDIRSLIIYDVPSRSKVLSVDGINGTEGWIDSVTVRVWVLSGYDLPRSLCPDIKEGFGVGVDSLFALNLETLSLKALGPWRCNQLQ